MTSPCPGLWFKKTPEGIPVLFVHVSADPNKGPEWQKRERQHYSSQAFWDREIEMKDYALDGQIVYPEYNPAVHVIPDAQIPPRLCRYMAIDPHPRTPHAFLWVGIDAWGDWYVYRELWPSVVSGQPRKLKDLDEDKEYTVREYAETVAMLERNELELFHVGDTMREYGIYRRQPNGENIIYRYMDQAGKGFRASGQGQPEENYAECYERYGTQCLGPRKSHVAGEDAIRNLLRVRHHQMRGQWPLLHIAASCVELQLEFERHRYKTMRHDSDEKELHQQPAEARSHLLDDLRYLATSEIGFIESLVS